jgi:hypothetical protein
MSTPDSRTWLLVSFVVAVLAVAAVLLGPGGAARGAIPEARAPRDTTALPENWIHHLKSLPCIQPETGLRFSPLGLAFDIKGDLYVIDADDSRVLVAADSSAGFGFFAGCPRTAAGCELVDIAAYGGWFYVSDRSGGRVIALDSKGTQVVDREVGAGLGGIDVGPSGLVYGAMTISGSVVIADIYGEKSPITSSVAGGRDGSYPVDCLVQDYGRVLVADAFARQVLVLGPLGNPQGRLEGFDFKSPFGLCACLDRYVLVSDSELGLIAVFDSGGKFLGTFGRSRLRTPTFIAARDDGTVCVSDVGNLSIEVFRLDDLSHP